MVQRPFQLGDGEVRIDKRHIRGGEDPFLVRKAPIFVHPPVERLERRQECRHVVDERLLHADPEGGQEDRALYPLGIHQRQSGIAILVLGVLRQRVQIAEKLGRVRPLWVTASEVLVQSSWFGHRVPGRVGNETVDPTTYEQPLPSIDHRPLHGPFAELRVEMPGERVLGLVVVVVAVKYSKIKVAHLLSPLQVTAQLGGPSNFGFL
jgi:hypothetical protein